MSSIIDQNLINKGREKNPIEESDTINSRYLHKNSSKSLPNKFGDLFEKNANIS